MKELTARLRSLAFPVAMGLFLILIIAIGSVYLQQGARQREVRQEIAQMSLTALQAQRSAEELEAKFQRVQSDIPSADLKETDVYQVVLGIATRTGVEADISFQSETVRQVLKTRYRVLMFEVKAQGDNKAVRDFIETLDQGQLLLKTLVVEDLNISGGEKASASIDFVVYTHVGKG